MRKKLKYFLTLLWFAYLIVSSILLFKKGFLLSKEVQNKNSTCSPLELNELSGCSSASCSFSGGLNIYSKANSLCLPSDTKVILLIVDALRYDFTVFSEDNLKPLPYENRLPIIKKTLDKFPASSRLYKFIADPPTTTMQRIKALTTGSLPTFIDAGSNFASSEITEDNIIDQVLKMKEDVVFMGDDTWTSLYPNRFVRNFPYPSFDVWDLDTVDNGVRTNLFPELKKRDWKMLIGHFLGVDHCGHRHGPNHPEMVRKLTEINRVIQDVIEVMDNETMLFVIGDHGMTITGDHGGATEDEVSSAMFVYSKQTLLSIGDHKSSVKQVDLVPTLSAILGVPVPFQNLGVLIHNALPETKNSRNLRWKVPLFWLWHNARQIASYMQTYSENSKIFDQHYLELYYSEIELLQAKLAHVASDEEFSKLSEAIGGLLVKLRVLCEEVWVQFDAYSISNGLTFLFLSVFFMFIISDGIPLRQLPAAIEGSFVVVCVIGLLVSATAVAAFDFSGSSGLFVTNMLSHFMFLLPVFQNWAQISFNWYQKDQANGVMHVVCRLVLTCNIAGAFSNSYVLEEASAVLFLLVTVLVVALLVLVRSEHGKSRVKLGLIACSVLFLLRFTVNLWRCRTEQEWCFLSPHEEVSRIKSQASKAQWGVSVVSLALLVILAKVWLRKCGNLSGFSLTEVLNKLLPSVVVVCVAGYWVLQRLAGNTKSIARTSNYLAWAVYGLCGLSVIVAIMRPICVHVVSAASSGPPASIAGVFSKLRASFLKKEEIRREDVPIVSGLGTVYSAVYVILATYLLLVTALVLGDLFAVALVVMVVVGTFFLVATSVWRIKEAKTWEDLLNVPTLVVLGWILLPQYFFFASGHQPAFSNIAWESAFVGTSGLVSSNQYMLGSLILLNTFGTYMLAGILLPLLLIVPFTLCVMMPSVAAKNKVLHPNAQKGELFLFEHDRISTAALFSLSCKYMAGHTVKVFASMLAATIHCRHLMVWSIFAPKFIFEAIALFITLGSVLVGYLLFVRINSQIERLVTKLNKTQ